MSTNNKNIYFETERCNEILYEVEAFSSTLMKDLKELFKILDVTEAPSEEILRDQEANILQLGERLREEGKTKEMTDLIQKVRNFLRFMSKAKAAKLVRGLVDMFLEMERSEPRGEREVQLCKVRLIRMN